MKFFLTPKCPEKVQKKKLIWWLYIDNDYGQNEKTLCSNKQCKRTTFVYKWKKKILIESCGSKRSNHTHNTHTHTPIGQFCVEKKCQLLFCLCERKKKHWPGTLWPGKKILIFIYPLSIVADNFFLWKQNAHNMIIMTWEMKISSFSSVCVCVLKSFFLIKNSFIHFSGIFSRKESKN